MIAAPQASQLAVPATASHVPCVTCKQLFPPGQVDVVGHGYRCNACSHRAEIAVLNGARDFSHVSQRSGADRDRLHRSGTQAMWFGFLSIVAGIVVCVLAEGPAAFGLSLVASGTGLMLVGGRQRGAAR